MGVRVFMNFFFQINFFFVQKKSNLATIKTKFKLTYVTVGCATWAQRADNWQLTLLRGAHNFDQKPTFLQWPYLISSLSFTSLFHITPIFLKSGPKVTNGDGVMVFSRFLGWVGHMEKRKGRWEKIKFYLQFNSFWNSVMQTLNLEPWEAVRISRKQSPAKRVPCTHPHPLGA